MLKNIIDLNLKIQLIKLSLSVLTPTTMTTSVDRPVHSAVRINSSFVCMLVCVCVHVCMCVCVLEFLIFLANMAIKVLYLLI